MLFKVQYQHHRKYIKITGSSYDSVKDVKQKFDISTDHKVYLADETGTEVDEDVFADIIDQKPDFLWMIVDAVAVADSPVHTSCDLQMRRIHHHFIQLNHRQTHSHQTAMVLSSHLKELVLMKKLEKIYSMNDTLRS